MRVFLVNLSQIRYIIYCVVLEAIEKVEESIKDLGDKVSASEGGRRLWELHWKLQGQFEAVSNGRKLLKEGRIKKQSRKGVQQRYLILVSCCCVLNLLLTYSTYSYVTVL